MLAGVRTPSGATCKDVLQLEAIFSEVNKSSVQGDHWYLGLPYSNNK